VIYTDAQTGPTRPSQTPDGASVIYEREFPGSTEIWIRTADGKPDRRLAAVPVTGVRAELQSVLSPDGTQIGYTIGQETDSPTGYVIGVRSGVPTRLCENCILFGFLSDSRRIIAIENRLRVRVIDTMSREGQDVLRSASGQVYRTHASPNDKWIAFQHNGKVWVTPLDPGRPPDESSWTAVDEPTKSGRPAGWATDSSVLYLILETDGFRCLYGQRIDPAGHLVDKPYAVRHFHNTGLQEYSTSFGNAITSDGFLYGGGVLKANLWRLRLSR
jgi:Tol biopolymer transport system component